jgi:hypothetical protein
MTKKEVLQTIQRLSNFYGAKIPMSVLADSLKMSVEEAKAFIQNLREKGELRVKLTDEIKPKRVYTKRSKDTPVESSVIPEKQKIVKRVKVPKKSRRKIKLKDDFSILVIRFIMGFIGFGASGMSCYYTTVWLLEFLPWFLAFLLSFLMIIFAVLSVQVALILSHTLGRVKLILIPMFSILWLVVTVFSMGSTVAGQYNINMSSYEQDAQIDGTLQIDQIQLEVIQSNVSLTENELKARQKDRDTMLDSLSAMEMGSDEYNTIWWRMNSINGRINELVAELRTYREQYSIAVSDSGALFTRTEEKKIVDFYSWLSGLFGVRREQVQFWSSVFPAIFIDLIAPIGVATALFLHTQQQSRTYNKKRKKHV